MRGAHLQHRSPDCEKAKETRDHRPMRTICVLSRVKGLKEAMVARGLDVAAFEWFGSAAALETDAARTALSKAEGVLSSRSAVVYAL